jgi:hypothetical protein
MSESLRITAIEIDGTVTRPLRFGGPPGEALSVALREAMLKRGCLRDRDHKGQCLNCALLPQCAVWPAVAPADPTQRQRGPYVRPFVLRLPDIPPTGLQPGARVTYGATIVQDPLFPALWGAYATAFVQAARQIAEWGFGLAVREGEQAARRGAISMGRARWLNPITGETQPYTNPESGPEPPLFATFSVDIGGAEADTGDSLSLTFVTPTRLVAARAPVQHPEPTLLIRRIAERLDAVADSVGVAEPGLLADGALVDASQRLQVRDDQTTWVGETARGGFVGTITLAGDPDDLARVAPVLRWGAALGVGKGTLHGAGRFVVGPVPDTVRIVMTAEPPPTRPDPPVEPTRRASPQSGPKRPPLLRKRTHKGNRKR